MTNILHRLSARVTKKPSPTNEALIDAYDEIVLLRDTLKRLLLACIDQRDRQEAIEAAAAVCTGRLDREKAGPSRRVVRVPVLDKDFDDE